jgi:hypothetical protein
LDRGGVGAFGALWVVLACVRVPYLVALWPGVLSFDSIEQLQQVVGAVALKNHHPVAHTLVVSAWVHLAQVFGGGVGAGVGLYSVFQLLALTGVFAYALVRLRAWGMRGWAWWVAVAFFAVYDVHGYYAVTMWKDVLFSAAVLLSTVALVDVLGARAARQARRTAVLSWVLLIVGALGTLLLRNNGLYVVVLTGVACVAFGRGRRGAFLGLLVGLLVVHVVWTGPVFRALGVEAGSSREALSVPLQQLARVCRDKPQALSDEAQTVLYELLERTPEQIAADYDPLLANPVKDTFDDAWFAQHKGEFLRVWLETGRAAPGVYVASFLQGNYGYWWPFTRYWVTSDRIYPNDLGVTERPRGWVAPTPAELYRTKTVPQRQPGGWAMLNPRNMPVVQLIYHPGTAFWVLLCAACVPVVRAWRVVRVRGTRGCGPVESAGRTPPRMSLQLLLAWMPCATLWLTCLAGPVFDEYRYVYALFLCAPVLLSAGSQMRVKDRSEEPDCKHDERTAPRPIDSGRFFNYRGAVESLRGSRMRRIRV